MTQNARVVKILGQGKAEVVIERASACGGNCASCGACATNRLMRVVVSNKIVASEGDEVVIKTKTSKIIMAAFVVYIIPFILFFIAYAVTAAAKCSEKVSILFSAAAFILGSAIAFLYNRHIKNKSGVEFEIIAFRR